MALATTASKVGVLWYLEYLLVQCTTFWFTRLVYTVYARIQTWACISFLAWDPASKRDWRLFMQYHADSCPHGIHIRISNIEPLDCVSASSITFALQKYLSFLGQWLTIKAYRSSCRSAFVCTHATTKTTQPNCHVTGITPPWRHPASTWDMAFIFLRHLRIPGF